MHGLIGKSSKLNKDKSAHSSSVVCWVIEHIKEEEKNMEFIENFFLTASLNMNIHVTLSLVIARESIYWELSRP